MIKTLLFDLGGVLLNLDKEACIQSFINLGYKDVRSMITNYRQEGMLRLLESGLVTPDEFCDGIRKLVGKEVEDEVIKEAVRSFLLDIPMYKLEYLAELKKNYHIVMLSNTSSIAIEYIYRRNLTSRGLKLDNYFDECYYSFELKSMKPDDECFERMIEQSGLDPKETLFLDDSMANLEASKKFGFQTFYAKEYTDWREELNQFLTQNR